MQTMSNLRSHTTKLACALCLSFLLQDAFSVPLGGVVKPPDYKEVVLPDEDLLAPSATTETQKPANFFEALVKAFCFILVSELGDKTFFIAAIFAMKHARTTVFAGAIGALALMTALSVAMGSAAFFLPKELVLYCSVVMFLGWWFLLLFSKYEC